MQSLFNTEKVNPDRVNRIMQLIELEADHPLSQDQGPAPIDLDLPQTSSINGPIKKAPIGHLYKKILVAAALVLALLITPFNGTSFAGELINWTKSIEIFNARGVLAGENKLHIGLGQVDAPKETLDSLEETLAAMGSLAFDVNTLPKGLHFTNAEIYEGTDPIYERYVLNFMDDTNHLVKVELNTTQRAIPDYVEESSAGIMVSGTNLDFSDLQFLDQKALLYKYDDRQNIISPNLFIDHNDLRYWIYFTIAYSDEEYPTTWDEGLDFLETWYTNLKTK